MINTFLDVANNKKNFVNNLKPQTIHTENITSKAHFSEPPSVLLYAVIF